MAKQYSLGLIETIGLTAAIVAADAAVKSANVSLVGYELCKGNGMTTVKVQGDVGAVTAAISAASAAAGQIGQVVSTRVIARPATHLEMLIHSQDTVGIEHTEAVPCTPCAHIPPPLADTKPEQPLPEQALSEQTMPIETIVEQTTPVEAQPEQALPEQPLPEQPLPEQPLPEQALPEGTPNSDESEAEADDEPHQPKQETESAGDAEKTDGQKKRKKKK